MRYLQKMDTPNSGNGNTNIPEIILWFRAGNYEDFMTLWMVAF